MESRTGQYPPLLEIWSQPVKLLLLNLAKIHPYIHSRLSLSRSVLTAIFQVDLG